MKDKNTQKLATLMAFLIMSTASGCHQNKSYYPSNLSLVSDGQIINEFEIPKYVVDGFFQVRPLFQRFPIDYNELELFLNQYPLAPEFKIPSAIQFLGKYIDFYQSYVRPDMLQTVLKKNIKTYRDYPESSTTIEFGDDNGSYQMQLFQSVAKEKPFKYYRQTYRNRRLEYKMGISIYAKSQPTYDCSYALTFLKAGVHLNLSKSFNQSVKSDDVTFKNENCSLIVVLPKKDLIKYSIKASTFEEFADNLAQIYANQVSFAEFMQNDVELTRLIRRFSNK